jgi:hypothetical protein
MLPQMNAAEQLDVRKVWFIGTDTLQEGYVLCFDPDAALADADPRLRLGVAVEKPAAGNVNAFAGIVSPSSAGVTGPGFVDIIVPRKNGMTRALVKADVTAFTTLLGPVAGSYALGAVEAGSGNLPVEAVAAQTADTSEAAAVQAIQFK